VVGADGMSGFLGREAGDSGKAVLEKDGVCVEVEEPLAGGGFGSLLTGPGFPFPALGHFLSCNDSGA
jgi:hypothetical protein